MEMLQINGLEEGLELFKTLGSDVRMQIVALLAEHGDMNLNEIASALSLTNGALTLHIRKLIDSGIIDIAHDLPGRGNQKRCRLKTDQVLLNVLPSVEISEQRIYESEIHIGHFSNYSVKAPCGLASSTGILGEKDDPRYFTLPSHLNAELLWFSEGFIEYRIPNLIPEDQAITEIIISFEISSAFYGSNEASQASISFFLNHVFLGNWISSESTDGAAGIFTPSWWSSEGMWHGFLHMILINQSGVFLDGAKLSDRKLDEWNLESRNDLILRFQVDHTAQYQGGLALYGSGFGNYQQNIMARIHYIPREVLNNPTFS